MNSKVKYETILSTIQPKFSPRTKKRRVILDIPATTPYAPPYATAPPYAPPLVADENQSHEKLTLVLSVATRVGLVAKTQVALVLANLVALEAETLVVLAAVDLVALAVATMVALVVIALMTGRGNSPW